MKKTVNYQKEFLAHKHRRQIVRQCARAGGGSIVLVGLVYALFFAGWFDVRAMTIVVPPSISKSDIEQRVNQWLDQGSFGMKHRRNSILFSPSSLEPVLSRAFPRINTVHVSRKSVHELRISITDRKPTGIWCLTVRSQCYYFDETGKAYAEIAPTEGFLFTAINDGRDRDIQLGKEVGPDDWRAEILAVKRIAQFGSLPIAEFQIPKDSFDEFDAKTKEGWIIRFSMQTNISHQTNNLLAFLKEKIKPEERAALQYVDLTIPDRIYYK